MGFITRDATKVGPSYYAQDWITLELFLISNKLIEITTTKNLGAASLLQAQLPWQPL